MKSISSSSMGSRLGKAKDIIAQLTTYPDWAPVKEELTVPQLKIFIESIEKQNADTVVKIQDYSVAVDMRRKSFTKENNSLSRFATRLLSLVRYSYDRDSKEVAAIYALTQQIRGARAKKKKPPKQGPVEAPKPPATTEGDTTVPPPKSRSERTFGNMRKIFDDIVATIVSFNSTYKGTGEFSVDSLKAKSAALADMNEKAVITHSLLRQARESRTQLYVQLSTVIKDVKDAATAQYGTSSSLHKLVKGIRM